MDKPGYRYALSALREGRSALAGEIDALTRRIAHCERDMAHVDAILTLLAPSADPAKLPKKRFQQRVKIFRQGDLGRLIIGVLRAAGRPMGTHQIATAIEAAAGFAPGSLVRRVRGNLSYLAACL
jgi:hypothetical protein